MLLRMAVTAGGSGPHDGEADRHGDFRSGAAWRGTEPGSARRGRGAGGGAGPRIARAPYEQGLLAAYRAGWQVLAAGGDALDAVCASVEVLEDDPLFNAGRGAALTAIGAR